MNSSPRFFPLVLALSWIVSGCGEDNKKTTQSEADVANVSVAANAKVQAELDAWKADPLAYSKRPQAKYDKNGKVIPADQLSHLPFNRQQQVEQEAAQNGQPVDEPILGNQQNLTGMKYVLKKGYGFKMKNPEANADGIEFAGGREQIVIDELGPEDRAAIQGNDVVEKLFDTSEQLLKDVEIMDREKYTKGQLHETETPWSDDYWPIYKGILANRYGDPGFRANFDFRSCRDYWHENETWDIVQSVATPNASSYDQLSPAEKYDILVGDVPRPGNEGFTLSKRQWEQGDYYSRDDQEVETWMGICHGWAQAAYMIPRPPKPIEVTAAGGEPLTFYPADIKALGSLLYANARVPSNFIGGRCNDKDPETDENGRVLDEACFNTNPGTFHLALVNALGKGIKRRGSDTFAKESFVMDATYDYEVWNQPVFSYSYEYFNPTTNQSVATLAEALVPMKSETIDGVEVYTYEGDKFAKHRKADQYTERNNRTNSFLGNKELDNNNAGDNLKFPHWAIGVYMEVEYVVETRPFQKALDTYEDDATHTVRYIYDLELTEKKEIVGGEWRSLRHPDFLWTPKRKATAGSPDSSLANLIREGEVSEWALEEDAQFPTDWTEYAIRGSKRGKGIPLANIVESLIAKSRGETFRGIAF